jgi:hypothetical protein
MDEEATSNFTFEFPIREFEGEAPMKTIPLSTLLNFHGLSREDTYTFLFEFYVLCHNYDYVSDAQKLKLFPTTLKSGALRWFMGLVGNPLTHGAT